ncbi:MAG: ribonuclease Y [Myxococcota bacterium]|nr:ribonuclease Y [Myxococcota bacterium]
MEMVVAIGALMLGIGLGLFVASRRAKTQLDGAQRRLERLKADQEQRLEQLKEELTSEQQASEDELKQSIQEARAERAELQEQEKQLKSQRAKLDTDRQKLAQDERSLDKKEARLTTLQERLADQEGELNSALERVANLTQEEALARLEAQLMSDAEQRAAGEIRRLQQQVTDNLREESTKLLAKAVFRYGSETVAEITTTAVNLPSDESKGRIIGREGRNIQAFEQATGVDVIIDDTPELITLSCFNPVRREVARMALERLIEDGRIHPSRIEESVKKAGSNLDKVCRQRGEDAAAELGVHGVNPALLLLLGKLQFHQVLGQDQLMLAINVAHLSELIAESLGQSPKVVRRAGLLSLVGRAADHHFEGSVAKVTADLAAKHGESKLVVAALQDLASDGDPATVAGMIVSSALKLAENRPGARQEQLGKAVERLTHLENLAASEEGVRSAHAVQAGREIRVLVDPDRVAEGRLLALAQRLARRIEEQSDTMGEVRVHVVRETRISETAM